jgi:hypothetical protein
MLVVRGPVHAAPHQKEGKSLGALRQRHITAENELGHPLTEISNGERNIVALMTIVTDKMQDTDLARGQKEENVSDVGVFSANIRVSLQSLEILVELNLL